MAAPVGWRPPRSGLRRERLFIGTCSVSFKEPAKHEEDPFGTMLRLPIAPPALRRRAWRNRLDVIYDEVDERPVQTHLRAKRSALHIGFGVLVAVSRFPSLRRLDLGLFDCATALRKRDRA